MILDADHWLQLTHPQTSSDSPVMFSSRYGGLYVFAEIR